MKLEQKHIAPYLPYNLYFIRYEKKCIDKTVNPVIWSKDLHPFQTQLNAVTLNGFDYEKSKPILRPISDLKRENEKYFFHFDNNEGLMMKRKNETFTRLNELDFLFENHYDVFGLIPQGLAIDINTL